MTLTIDVHFVLYVIITRLMRGDRVTAPNSDFPSCARQ